MDLSQFQGDANKLNPGVLRGIEGSTLHFIAIPRTTENEYIDSSLLSPEYIAHIPNGLVVDIITQSHDQQASISSHNIYMNSSEADTSPLEMTTERHYISSNESVTMPIESIHHSLHSSHSSMQPDHLNHRSHYDAGSTIQEDRKVNRQYILTNEAPVIVSNKEATAVMGMNHLDLASPFPNRFGQIDQNVLQDITKTNSSRMNDHHDLDSKIHSNALPPLTPLSKLQSMRKTPTIEQQQHHAMQYKNVAHSSASINMPKSNSILRNVCFLTEDDEMNLVQSNIKLGRQSSKEHTIAPKRNLPHKKRITKKLKSISPSLDQMQAIDVYQDLAHLHTHSNHDQSYSISNQQQTETLNLTLNQQPIQLTTPRITHHNQTEFIPSEHHFSTHPQDVTNGMHQVQLQQIPESLAEPRFTCEICGMPSQTQLGFFNHLKLHYEPESAQSEQSCKIESIRSVHNASLSMEQNNQNMFEMSSDRKMSANQCMTDDGQTMNQPVIMTDNFGRLQSNEQDFSCISGIGNEDVTDDESINAYNDTGLNVKSEQNEFSDTEDMLENGVLDKVQRVVDSYIENGTSDVKNLIDLNESQHHANLVDNQCNWTTNNSHTLSNNSVYGIEKNDSVNNMSANSFVITSNKEPSQTAQNHIINNTAVIKRPEELALIYEINVNDKDFPIMDDNSTESILRRQLARPENEVNNTNQNQFESIEASSSKSSVLSMDREISTYISETAAPTSTKLIIQDEFIEEEQTDSDVDAGKPDAPKKKRKIYRCKRCNKLCNSKNALHYHFLSHSNIRPFQCNECGKSFFASSALKVHKRLHSGDKPYNCDFCNRPFRQWGDLKYHIQSKHTKEKSHQCEFCGKDFARRYSLVIHRRIHTGERNYKCEFCDKEFRASSYLQVHRKIHTGEKPFVCPVCGKRFRVRGDLKRHSNIHERNKTKDAKIEDLSCISNGSSNGKNEMFIIDDNNTLESRSTDTLDHLVSVIESTDAAMAANENSNESMKKRNFMQIDYEKNFTKVKHKRNLKVVDTPSDDYSAIILDYSADHLTFNNGNGKSSG